MTAPVILDMHGQPISRRAYGDTAWNAASRGRELRKWLPSRGSADTDNNPELVDIRSRARDLDRNESSVTGALLSAQSAIVGSGLTFTPDPDYVALGRDQGWADEWSEHTESVLSPWFETADCDATRHDNFGGLTNLTLGSVMLSGSAIAIAKWLDDPSITDFSTAIQLIEPDRLCNPNFGPDTPTLSNGVHLDEHGRHLGYWIMTMHPGDAGRIGWEQRWEYIPAKTPWGRQQVIYVYDRKRIGQNHGVSILAPVVADFHTLSRYKQAELQAALANAIVAIFSQTEIPWEELREMFDGPEEFFKFREANQGKMSLGDLARVIPLAPNEKIESFKSERPNVNFEPFSKSILRQAYNAMGMAYEIGSKDLGGLNYSSARTAILETWRTWGTKRDWTGRLFATPCYRLVFEEAVHAGKIRDCTPDDYYANPYAWTRCQWNGPGMGWVDPVKEAQGATLRISGLTSTLQRENANDGLKWRRTLRQQKVERDLCRELGIPYPGDKPVVVQKEASQEEEA